jgi:hypothetical protein
MEVQLAKADTHVMAGTDRPDITGDKHSPKNADGDSNDTMKSDGCYYGI